MPALTGAATPTMVVTTPLVVTFRMQLLPASATNRLSAPSTVKPENDQREEKPDKLKLAAAPVPSALPPYCDADPASVVTTPAAVIFRMVLLPESATKTLPAPSAGTPLGTLKLAAAPVPSALPYKPAVPASVVTTPLGVIFRIVL